MKLKKKIVISRHGLRYPLINKKKMEEKIGFPFINWNFDQEEMGFLTPKGEMLEFKLGHQLRKEFNYLKINKLLANSMHRTYLTARILGLSIMPFKEIKLNTKYQGFELTDEKFNFTVPIDFKINPEYTKKIDEKLQPVYNKMKEIMGSRVKVFDIPTTISILPDGMLKMDGALRYATDICNLYILKYYENFKFDDIFESDSFMDDLRLVSTAKDEFLDLMFGSKEFIENATNSILDYLKDALNDDNLFHIIVGHDSNIAMLMSALNIDYKVNTKHCIEKYPVGSKLIIDIYEDDSYEINYAYFDYNTIRNMDDKKFITELLKKGKNINETLKN